MKFDFVDKSVLLLLFFSSFPMFAQTLRFEKKPDGIMLLEDDAPRYFYCTAEVDSTNAFSRSNYIHPL